MLSEWDSLSSWTVEHGCTVNFHNPSDVDVYTQEFTAHAAHILHQHPGLELPDQLGLWFYQGVPAKYRSLNRACLQRLLLSHVEDVPFPTTRELVKTLKDEITFDIEHPDAEYPLFPIHPKIIDLIDSYCYRNVPDTRLLARIYSASLSARSSPDPTQCQPSFDLEPHSSDNITWPLFYNAFKSESTNIYDIEQEALHAEYSPCDSVEPLKSSHRPRELSLFDIHGPIDHVVPIAIQSLTNEATEPAITTLTPNAIIDDVKHDFCPPTTTAAPPLEEPPPRPPSDALPISLDLEDSCSILDAASDPKDHAKAIMNSTDNSGPHLSSTPNLCPRSRVDAPHVFDENTISQASPSLQNCDLSSTPLTASDWQNILEIGLDNTTEGAEKVQATMEIGLDDEPMHLTTDIEHEAPHAEYPSIETFKLFTSSYRMNEHCGIDSHGPFDQVIPTAIQISTNKSFEPADTALTPTAIINDANHDFCPPTTTTVPPLEEPPPRLTFDPLLASADLEHSTIIFNAPPGLEHRGGTIKTSTDDSGFNSRPHLLSTPTFCPPTPRSDAPHTYCADDTIPQAPQTLQDLEFGPTSSSVLPVAPDPSTILKISIDTTSEGAQKIQDTIGTGLDDALMSPTAAKYRFVDANGVDPLLKADDTFSHTHSLLGIDKSSFHDELRPREVPATVPPPFSLEKALINIISNSLDPDTATYCDSISNYEPPVPSDGASATPPLKPSITNTLSQQDIDFDPPPPYSFDDPPGTLADPDKEGTRLLYGAKRRITITRAQDAKAFLCPTANRQLKSRVS
ncbi:hypothetical protein DXG01_006497, partial [Tephrocybe rancida]